MQKATIYTKSEFFGNIVKVECHFMGAVCRKYAQYQKAFEVTFKRKRSRSASSIMLTYKPYMVVVEGWNQPDPRELCDLVDNSNPAVTVRKSSYASFDERFCTDFDELIDSGKMGKILFDARYTKGVNCY